MYQKTYRQHMKEKRMTQDVVSREMLIYIFQSRPTLELICGLRLYLARYGGEMERYNSTFYAYIFRVGKQS